MYHSQVMVRHVIVNPDPISLALLEPQLWARSSTIDKGSPLGRKT
jgi:hypothetical protein